MTAVCQLLVSSNPLLGLKWDLPTGILLVSLGLCEKDPRVSGAHDGKLVPPQLHYYFIGKCIYCNVCQIHLSIIVYFCIKFSLKIGFCSKYDADCHYELLCIIDQI